MLKRLALFAAVLFGLAGLLVVGALLWVTSDEGSKRVSDKLKTAVYDKTGIEMSFEKIGINLFPPRISVQQIKGKDKDGRFSCAVDEAELSPDLPALLMRNLVVEEVYLGAPQCTVSLKSKDIDTLLADKPKSDTPFNFDDLPKFDVFAVSNADLHLDIDDPGRVGKLNAEMSDFGLDVTGDEGSIEIRGLLGQLGGTWSEGDKKVAEKLTGLEFRAAVSKESVDVRYVTADVAGAEIRARDAHIPIPLWPKGPDAADLTVRLPFETLNRLPLGLPELRGTAAFTGQIGVSKDAEGKPNVTSKGRVELLGIEADEFVIGDIIANYAASPNGITFHDTEIHTADGNIRLSGNVALEDNLPIELRADLNNIELGRLLEQVTVDGSYVTQYMTGPVKLTGTLAPFSVSGNVKLDVRDHITRTSSFRSKDYMVAIALPRTQVTGPIFITDKTFEGKALSVKSGASEVTVGLFFDFPGFKWRLQADSQNLHLEDVQKILGFEVGGHGPVHCTIAGPINDPGIHAQVNFAEGRLLDMAFDRVSTDINFHDLHLSFDGMEIARKGSRISTSRLSFDFSAPGGLTVDTKIDAEKAEVETLMEVFHIDEKRWGSPTGLLFGRLALHYNLAPEHLEASADLVHDKLQVFGERFGPDVLRLDWNNGTLVVNELGLTKGHGTIYVTGTMREDGTMSFIGNANGINLSGVNNPTVRGLGINAQAQAFVVVEGTLEHPTGTIELSLGETERLGARFGPSQIALTLDGDRLKGKGNLAGDKVTLEHLLIDLDKERFQVEGYAADLDIVPLLDLDSLPKGTELSLTGDLSLGGRLSNRPGISGNAELMRVRMKVGDFSFENKQPMRIAAERDRFKIQDTRFWGPDVVFDFGGTLGLDRMNLKLNGLANLQFAAGMVSGITKTEGELRFELSASGPLTEPSFRGSADLEKGMVHIGGFPHDIRNIAGTVSITPKIIRFSDFTAGAANGTLGLSGEMEIANGKIGNYGFRLTAEDLELAPMKDLAFKASTVGDGLFLSSPARGKLPNITGDVEVSQLRYTADMRVLELADLSVDRLSGTQVRARSPKVIDPTKDFFSFDIRLHGTRNLEAHNNLFDVLLSVDDREKPLRFVGTNQNFGFLGRILGKEGKVRFAGRRFDIRFAAVDFQDADRPENPSFQVIADGTVRDWKVTLTAEGTVDEYELKFSSQPYLSKEDIAFLILTGLTQAENRQFNRGVNLGMPLIGQLGPGGGLPVELQVYSKYSDNAGKDTTRIAMGRWINDDIWVSISSAVGQTRDVEAHVDYKINDEVSISGRYEEGEQRAGNVGVDLKFRLEF